MFYTYLWLREDGTPYYAGKGYGTRAFKLHWHNKMYPPASDRIIVQEWLSEEDAFEAEKFLITYYGRIDLGTGCLRNLTDGGEGTVGKSEEALQRISKALRGNTHTLGYKHSEKAKQKMSEAAKGNTKGNANRGRKRPDVAISGLARRMPEEERLRRRKDSKQKCADKPESKLRKKVYRDTKREENKLYMYQYYRDHKKKWATKAQAATA